MLMSRLCQLMVVLAGLLVASDLGHAKVFGRCELARKLRTLRIPRAQIADWVCLAYHESGYDTAAVGRLNQDGSKDHGIFQISDLYWCDWSSNEPRRTYRNFCRENCNVFRNSDISGDLACALFIYDEHQRLQGNGFLAWTAWRRNCQGRNLAAYVQGCGI